MTVITPSSLRLTRTSISMGTILLVSTSVAFAENCLIYTNQSDKLRCMEEFYSKNSGGNGGSVSSGKKPATGKSQITGSSRATVSPKTPDQVDARRREPRAGPAENTDAILNNLAGQHTMEAAGSTARSTARQAEEVTKRQQANSYYNACATDYCRQTIEPYQRKVDELQGTNGAAKAAAEAELRWQFRVIANPP